MSAYRDSLADDETRARYDAACAAAGESPRRRLP